MNRTSRFLMANLGSEVSRLLAWKEKGDSEMVVKCRERAARIESELSLLPEMQGRKIELDMLHMVIDDMASKRPSLQIGRQTLKAYFYPFAARLMTG